MAGILLNRNEIKRSKEFAKTGRRLIREIPELKFISENKCKVAFLTSEQEKTSGGGQKKVFGQCIKVSEQYQWICPYHFMIVVYSQNCAGFSDEQFEILLLHELLHIGFKEDSIEPMFYIREHDYEEFKQIVDKYGLEWSELQ